MGLICTKTAAKSAAAFQKLHLKSVQIVDAVSVLKIPACEHTLKLDCSGLKRRLRFFFFISYKWLLFLISLGRWTTPCILIKLPWCGFTSRHSEERSVHQSVYGAALHLSAIRLDLPCTYIVAGNPDHAHEHFGSSICSVCD